MENKKNKKQEVTIEYGIKSIKEDSFLTKDIPVSKKDINLQVKTKLEFDTKNNEIKITPFVEFIDSKTKTTFLKLSVENTFGVKNLKKFEKTKNGKDPSYDLPDQFIQSLTGMSISHTRAILAKNTNNTKFEKFILPIIQIQPNIGKEVEKE